MAVTKARQDRLALVEMPPSVASRQLPPRRCAGGAGRLRCYLFPPRSDQGEVPRSGDGGGGVCNVDRSPLSLAMLASSPYRFAGGAGRLRCYLFPQRSEKGEVPRSGDGGCGGCYVDRCPPQSRYARPWAYTPKPPYRFAGGAGKAASRSWVIW
jgi:hypothetical protein